MLVWCPDPEPMCVWIAIFQLRHSSMTLPFLVRQTPDARIKNDGLFVIPKIRADHR
jgi:hypothetical protein